MKGWQCEQALVIEVDHSPYRGQKPAPRVLQNQMDQHLEAIIVSKEKCLLSSIQEPISHHLNRVDIFAAIVVLLMVVEKDIWRLIYWTKHASNVSEALHLKIYG